MDTTTTAECMARTIFWSFEPTSVPTVDEHEGVYTHIKDSVHWINEMIPVMRDLPLDNPEVCKLVYLLRDWAVDLMNMSKSAAPEQQRIYRLWTKGVIDETINIIVSVLSCANEH